MPSRIDDHAAPGPAHPLHQNRHDQPPLGDAINRATRSVHARLNKLIILRLPLALPPAAQDASNYAEGLLHIAPIYMTFEALWRDMIQEGQDSEEGDEEDDNDEIHPQAPPPTPSPLYTCGSTNHAVPSHPSHGANRQQQQQRQPPHRPAYPTLRPARPPTRPRPSQRIRALLARLHMPALERALPLRADLASLTGWSARTLDAHLDEVLMMAEEDEEEGGEYDDESRKGNDDGLDGGGGGELLSHARRVITEKPHVLLAYAWVLYMALFSGGRFIRASLSRTDPRFWTPLCEGAAGAVARHHQHNDDDRARGAENELQSSYPLRFFSFASEVQGQDEKIGAGETTMTREGREDGIKRAFKARLAESETLLTPSERDDVVREACDIFELMIRLVGELDGVCGGAAPGEEGQGGAQQQTRALAPHLLGLRSRDSVVVERERRDKAKTETGTDGKRPAGAGAPSALGMDTSGNVRFG